MSPSDQIRAVYGNCVDLPDVTWVGPNPRIPGHFLGFDDGTFIFTDATNGHVSAPQLISPSGEAINGIAAVGVKNLAFSTRSEVSFIQADGPNNHLRMIFPGGAHGVIATESGSFIAPLGPGGLLVARLRDDHHHWIDVGVKRVKGLYFYRVAALHDGHGKETLVFAHRKGGVGVSAFDDSGNPRPVHLWALEGMEIVDVCALARGSSSAVAISNTGDVLWIEDASKPTKPEIFRVAGIRGTIYRILATSRHLFVLTSKALYSCINFVDRVRSTQSVIPDVMMVELPADAVDMSSIGDQYLLLVMATNMVSPLSLAQLEELVSERRTNTGLPDFSYGGVEKTSVSRGYPTWRAESIEYEVELSPVSLF